MNSNGTKTVGMIVSGNEISGAACAVATTKTTKTTKKTKPV